jgi:small redox-active disulfide protein 2
MIVKVLGPGCAKCSMLEKKVQQIVSDNSINAEVEKITDLMQIMNYGIISTPGLVINEKVVWSGSLPRDEQIVSWLKENQ